MDSLFRQSGLYRPKWDERHGAAGQTYGEITVAAVLADFSKAKKVERQGGPAATVQASEMGGRIRFAADLLEEDIPEPRHVVPGLIQRGLMILAGKPKIGKSWLVLNLLVAVSSGGVALGRIPCPEGDVLYLALEDPKRRLHGRLKKVLAGASLSRRFQYALEWPRLDQGGADDIDVWLDAHSEAALVVIDVWKRIKPPPAKGSNAYDSDYDAIIQLQRLAIKHDVAIVVVHHLNKNPSEDDTDVISGSIGFTGGADGHIVMKLAGKDGAVFRGRARDVEPFDYALGWDRLRGVWSVIGDADAVQLSGERRAVIGALTESQERMRVSELASVLSMQPGPLRRLLWSMVRDGQVARYPDHTYGVGGIGNTGNADNSGNVGNVGNASVDQEEGASDVTERSRRYRVTDVTAVDGVSHIRCLKCGAPLVGQRQQYGYCATCSQGALYDDEEQF